MQGAGEWCQGPSRRVVHGMRVRSNLPVKACSDGRSKLHVVWPCAMQPACGVRRKACKDAARVRARAHGRPGRALTG